MKRMLKHMVHNPNATVGLPDIMEIVNKLRRISDVDTRMYMNVLITTLDYSGIILSSPGPTGQPGHGPTLLLQYMMPMPCHAIHGSTGLPLYLPMGHIPAVGSQWVPCKAAGKNYWVDPISGKSYEHDGGMLLIYSPGDAPPKASEAEKEEMYKMLIYRAEQPPTEIFNILTLLKRSKTPLQP